MRLGVYADIPYRRDGDVLSAEIAFVGFVAALAGEVERLTVLGRLDPRPGRASHALPAGVRFVSLPHYGSVAHVGSLLRAVRATRRRFVAELDELDAVWLFGPHPISSLLARSARRRGKTVFLGVRQDFPAYVRGRLPSRRWLWAVAAAWALELDFRLLSRRAPTVVVGEATAAKYRRFGGDVLATGFSLVSADDVAAAPAQAPGEPARILCVGRLDPEKNPLLLVPILTALRARGVRCRLLVAGSGPLRDELERRAAAAGVAGDLELLGYVPGGPELMRLYRSADVFLHVSLTEGLPQVLFEAAATGIPVVATDVGGVAAALGDGEAGLLVPPDDADAAADAVARLLGDGRLRERLAAAGLARVRSETLEAQIERLASFFHSYNT